MDNQLAHIQDTIQSSLKIKQDILSNSTILSQVELAIQAMVSCYNNEGQVLFGGNGGSAADAQHLAAELSGKFYLDRRPLNAEALHANSSYLTAASNDFSFDEAYARIVEAKGKKGDILVAISTSGNSSNIVEAVKVAKQKGMIIIALSGNDGGTLKNISDINIIVPSNDTPRIQECHILLGHIICEQVEKALFS